MIEALRIGRYYLHEEIASGGMGAVYFARFRSDAGFSKTVAIKRLHANFAKQPEVVAMLLQEARLVGRIQHPNVVSTLDVCVVDGETLLVMEYVHGQALSRLLRDAGRLGERCPSGVAAAIACNLLHGLHAAHQAKDEQGEPLGIIHRDVSPQNVLVGEDGVARVLDFGIAKALDQSYSTRTGDLKGKIAYMAPEVLRNDKATTRSDVYAAGVVLWEALATKRLFAAESDGALYATVLAARVPPPSEVCPDVPAELDELVLRATSSDPALRYASAYEMALAIERTRIAAPVSEVSEWVKRIAAHDLCERSARVKSFECLPPPSSRAPTPLARNIPDAEGALVDRVVLEVDPGVTLPGGPGARQPTSKRRSPGLAVVVLGALLLLVPAMVFAARNMVLGRASRAPIALSAEAPRSIASEGDLAAASAGPAHQAPGHEDRPGDGVHPSNAVPMPSEGAPARRPGRRTKAVAPVCNPPYYLDERGKHWKPECLTVK